jgi:hypothetical protein
MQLKSFQAGFVGLMTTLCASGFGAIQPYYGAPLPVPGIIEAFEYDHGGEGLAYHDSTKGNQGSSYRAHEDVDLVAHGGVGGGYRIGWIREGEWVRYTFQVSEAGRYQFRYQYSSGMAFSSRMRVVLDGRQDLDDLLLPKTRHWEDLKSVNGNSAELNAGVHFVIFQFLPAVEVTLPEEQRCCADFGGFSIQRASAR